MKRRICYLGLLLLCMGMTSAAQTSTYTQKSDSLKTMLKGKQKKDPQLLLALARSYRQEGHADVAAHYLELARKADSRNPSLYLLEGDMALDRKQTGQACQAYEQAIYFDPDCREAYLKYADAYRTASPAQAIDMLQRLKKRFPHEAEADKALAEIYYDTNRFEEASQAYATFADLPIATPDDQLKYAFVLYLTHHYQPSLQRLEKIIGQKVPMEPLWRLRLYNHMELGNYEEAATAADSLFAQLPDTAHTALDRQYYATLHTTRLLHNGKQRYSDGLSEKEPTLRKTLLLQADSLFSSLTALTPESYLGMLWQARTRSALDPETVRGMAKPYYEQVATQLAALQDAQYNALLIECYSYLGYYYLLQEDYPTSRSYWERILQLDADNATARKALSALAKP